ncbi:thioredoxin domain-containing protein 9-like [Lineus longissimus]|uniref:thioredoxin domain-containing protein 9-like n=1 Tax=Lineus longissimus TaxID=88925 RepID=UPI00315DF299
MADLVGGAVQQQLIAATKIMEDQVDAELDKIDRMQDDDYDKLRQKQLENMKKSADQRQEFLKKGHGNYSEVPDEKEFFNTCKNSNTVVCHFYRESTERCKIVDMHMNKLAQQHVEAKFIKINAEKAVFLSKRLKIVVLPTICIAKDGKTVDYIVGFDDMGGRDDFPTEMLEWRIARTGVLKYSGDLMHPPGSDEHSKGGKLSSILGRSSKKNIRGRKGDDSSDDDDW